VRDTVEQYAQLKDIGYFEGSAEGLSKGLVSVFENSLEKTSNIRRKK